MVAKDNLISISNEGKVVKGIRVGIDKQFVILSPDDLNLNRNADSLITEKLIESVVNY